MDIRNDLNNDEYLEAAMMDSLYYSEGFQTVIEDHLILLQTSDLNSVIEVAPNDAYRFEYDYYNLLRFKGVPYRYHWVVMRVNGLLSPFDCHPGIRQIIIPNRETLERLMNMHLTAIAKVA